MGFITLDVGEQILVYNHKGEARIEKGPQRLYLWRSKYSYLDRCSADQTQYLVISFTDGRIEHVPGPTIVYRNPLIHLSVTTRDAISLDASEALVVYSSEAPEVKSPNSRRIVQGPTLFVPEHNEWLHAFEWHGTDPDNKTRVVPRAQCFKKLKAAPEQMYYNIDEVRTSDDALMRVKVMLFYEITDIERMLNETQDPIADLINGLCADVVIFASKITYIQFLENCQDLNKLESYEQLLLAAKRVGYTVSKVVFRGYLAHPKLQQMHDKAISERTHLQMQFESEQQQQQLKDVQLKSELERMDQEQNLATEKQKHSSELEQNSLKHRLELETEKIEIQQRHTKLTELQEVQCSCEKRKQEIVHLRKLKELGVDLTAYMLAQSPQPEKVIQVVGQENSILHLHRS